MPYYFGSTSKQNLSTCHPDIQKVFNEIIKYYDCSVLDGNRSKEKQNEYYHKGLSQLKYPESKHNQSPSIAIDVVPYFSNKPHIRWGEKEKFYEFAGFVMGVASTMGIQLRWGGNWDMDDELKDNTFMDYPHFELV